MTPGASHAGILSIDGQPHECRWVAPQHPDAGGPTLVFLHEGLGCTALWRDFPDAVAQATGLGALIYTRRGYGGSAPIPLPRPVDYMHTEALDILDKVLDAAGLGEVVLIGHSDGASIALIHAGGSPRRARVRGVVAMAPHTFVEDICLEGIRETRKVWETTDLRARLERWHGANVDCAFRGWNDTWLTPAFRAWSIEEFLPRITVPVAVIQGEQDEYATDAQVTRIAEAVAGPCRPLLLPDCRHSPHKDQREATLAATLDLIAQAEAGVMAAD